MPLVVQVRDQLDCPTVVCDQCGVPITEARDGLYQWRMGLCDSDYGNRLYFTHKRCCLAFEQAHPANGFSWGAITLECLPVYLGNNLKLRWQEARRVARLLSRLG